MKLSYKSVLDRHVRGETNKKVAESLQTTRKTVKRIIEKAEKLRLLPDAYLTFDEDGLRAKMNPRNKSRRDFYPVDWARIHEELTKRGSKCSDSNHTTMTLLYTEYTSEAEGAGKEAMSKTVFYDTYNMWVKGNQLVSHIKRQPGRRMELDFAGDTVVTTFDIRMTSPNDEPVMNTAEVHTLEHLGATFLRNHPEYKDKVLYFGPMGCRTGFYLLLTGDYSSYDILPLMREMYTFIADYQGEIPGASPKDCGNYLDMNLPMARYLARKFLTEVLANPQDFQLNYPE